jgi:hypothetical protein
MNFLKYMCDTRSHWLCIWPRIKHTYVPPADGGRNGIYIIFIHGARGSRPKIPGKSRLAAAANHGHGALIETFLLPVRLWILTRQHQYVQCMHVYLCMHVYRHAAFIQTFRLLVRLLRLGTGARAVSVYLCLVVVFLVQRTCVSQQHMCLATAHVPRNSTCASQQGWYFVPASTLAACTAKTW